MTDNENRPENESLTGPALNLNTFSLSTLSAPERSG
jgi:hypothetical protein